MDPCECNGGPECDCPDCDHPDCSYQQPDPDLVDELYENYLEASKFLAKAGYSEVMVNTAFANWASVQVMLGKAHSWQHALAQFVYDANCGLDFCRSISEFTEDTELLAKWLRGEHL